MLLMFVTRLTFPCIYPSRNFNSLYMLYRSRCHHSCWPQTPRLRRSSTSSLPYSPEPTSSTSRVTTESVNSYQPGQAPSSPPDQLSIRFHHLCVCPPLYSPLATACKVNGYLGRVGSGQRSQISLWRHIFIICI